MAKISSTYIAVKNSDLLDLKRYTSLAGTVDANFNYYFALDADRTKTYFAKVSAKAYFQEVLATILSKNMSSTQAQNFIRDAEKYFIKKVLRLLRRRKRSFNVRYPKVTRTTLPTIKVQVKPPRADHREQFKLSNFNVNYEVVGTTHRFYVAAASSIPTKSRSDYYQLSTRVADERKEEHYLQFWIKKDIYAKMSPRILRGITNHASRKFFYRVLASQYRGLSSNEQRSRIASIIKAFQKRLWYSISEDKVKLDRSLRRRKLIR